MDAMSSLKSGIDIESLDPLVRPQDDLFRHFAGTWLDTYEIPADRASDGVTHTLYDIAEVQVREIIETATGVGEAQKIGDLLERTSVLHESACERVAQCMRSRMWQAAPSICIGDRFLNRTRCAGLTARRHRTHKDGRTGARRSLVLQIVNKRLPGLDRQGQNVLSKRLRTPQRHRPRMPVEVADLQAGDFSGPQTQVQGAANNGITTFRPSARE